MGQIPAHRSLPSPLAGEGARRADEGSLVASAASSANNSDIPNPSSGATRHLLPQGEKGGGHHRAIDAFRRGAARRLRRLQTPQELKLWAILRARRFLEHKFRRQVPVGPYIADFVCFSHRLVLEVDGSQHADAVRDRVRDDWFSGEGFRVMRFWNNQIDLEPAIVSDAIWHALQEPAP